MSVSYTHLDVYKRQDEDNPQADGGKAAAGISVHAATGIEQ